MTKETYSRLSRGLALLLALTAIAVCAQAGPLRAGAARVDVTPPASVLPFVGGAGYVGVHDPLYVRALVLANDTTKIALITIDGHGYRGEEMLKAVSSALGIPTGHVILSATQDHSAPFTPPGTTPNSAMQAYDAQVERGTVEAAVQANAQLRPARIGFGTGKAYVNVNFVVRHQEPGGRLAIGYEPEAPSDKTVAVIALNTPAGDPIAVYMNYAMHSVVMFRVKSGPKGGQMITADLPGATADYVEKRLGHGAVAVWSTGAAGDQNPLFIGDYNQGRPDEHDEGPAAWAILDVQARRLGDEILRVTHSITSRADQAVLWGASATVTCPGQQLAPGEHGGPMGSNVAPENVRVVNGPPVKIPLTLVMINGMAIAGVAGDPFTEIGEHLKRDSLFDRTIVVSGLAAGSNAGYIPTDDVYSLPWEDWAVANIVPNRLKPGCAQPAIMGTFQKLMRQYLPIWKAQH